MHEQELPISRDRLSENQDLPTQSDISREQGEHEIHGAMKVNTGADSNQPLTLALRGKEQSRLDKEAITNPYTSQPPQPPRIISYWVSRYGQHLGTAYDGADAGNCRLPVPTYLGSRYLSIDNARGRVREVAAEWRFPSAASLDFPLRLLG